VVLVLSTIALFLLASLSNLGVIYSGIASKPIGLRFLEEVAGFDMESYNVTEYSSTGERIVIMFNDVHNKMVAKIFYQKGKFWWYCLEGDFPGGEPTLDLCLKEAYRFIEAYGMFFNLRYCSKFLEMLSTAIQSGNNVVESENLTLRILCSSNDTSRFVKLRYNYKFEGYEVDIMSLDMSVSKNGVVTDFSDTFNICSIPKNVHINVSKEEALMMARPYAERYARQHNVKIIETKVGLGFPRDMDCKRGSDPTAVYPEWSVEFFFDRLLEDGTYGYQVGIWADIGEVEYHGPAGIYYRPPSPPDWSKTPFVYELLAASFFVTILALFVIYCVKRVRMERAIKYVRS